MTDGDGVTLVKENLNISTLVGRYAQLRRKGSRLAACCPFHSEKTPSFYVDEAKGLFHCFGCGKGGDLIQFAQDIENLSFPEALDFLADLAGVELPKRRGPAGPSRDLIEALRAVNAEAASFYNRQLKSVEKASRYFHDRGIRESTVQLFKLGYASSQWDGLYAHLSKRFEPKLLQQSGLVKTSASGKTFDLFRERVIFPIQDAFGNVVAFGGRMIEGDEGPKYINSPESPLYTKGKHVYNLNFAKAYLKKEPMVIVVEGYLDAIQVYQAGIGNVVASLGTAFTPEQAKLLKRYAAKVLLNFDADAAGFKAARASIETLLKQDLDIGVVTLPDKQDPDDFIRASGPQGYREQLESARPFYEYLLEFFNREGDSVEDPRHRGWVAQELCQTLKHIVNPAVQTAYLQRIEKDLDLPGHVVDEIFRQKAEGVRASTAKSAASPRRDRNRKPAFSKLEQEFLHLIMHHEGFDRYFNEKHREALPKILGHVFYNRGWVLEFINNDATDLEERMAMFPESRRESLRAIYFSEDFDSEQTDRLENLFPDLLRQMLLNMAVVNKRRMRQLPPEDYEKKKELLGKNSAIMKQYHQLMASQDSAL